MLRIQITNNTPEIGINEKHFQFVSVHLHFRKIMTISPPDSVIRGNATGFHDY